VRVTNFTEVPIRALAFDLDGTLVDSAPDIGHALNSALREEGFGVFDLARVREWIGDGPDVLIERALAALGVSHEAALCARLRRGFDAATLQSPLAHGRVFDGIGALLARLRPQWPLVVVTNKPTVLARAVLEAAALAPYFTAVYGADTAALRKPAPNMLHRAADDLGVTAAQLLMVGDSGADLRAAQAAGSPAAWAEWGYAGAKPLPVQPRWRIAHPSQLWPILQAAARQAAG
jgi:phosphoglycolate phosphatase